VQLSTSILHNSCRRESTLTLNAIKWQLQLRNIVSLALARWTSTDRLSVMSVITNDTDQCCAFRELQHAFIEVNRLFLAFDESWIKMIGYGSTYRRKASGIYRERPGLISAYQWLVT
jgi:hypothetical protein